MNHYTLLVIFCVLQSTLVYSRTTEEVLEDFQPVFDELHNSISDLQTISHAEGLKQTSQIRTLVSQSSWDNQKVLESSMNDIRNEVGMVLGETGMIQHDDLVKHCFMKEQADLVTLNREMQARNYVCDKLGSKAIETLNNVLNNFYEEQASWHNNVEGVKTKDCASSTTPYEMQNCLIENLYLIQKPFVEEKAPEEMHEMLRSNDEYVLKVSDDLKVCFSIGAEKTIKDRVPVIDDFRRCVIEASENVPTYY